MSRISCTSLSASTSPVAQPPPCDPPPRSGESRPLPPGLQQQNTRLSSAVLRLPASDSSSLGWGAPSSMRPRMACSVSRRK